MTQLLWCLPSMHNALGSIPCTMYLVSSKAGWYMPCNPSTQEVETGEWEVLEYTRTWKEEGEGEGINKEVNRKSGTQEVKELDQ